MRSTASKVTFVANVLYKAFFAGDRARSVVGEHTTWGLQGIMMHPVIDTLKPFDTTFWYLTNRSVFFDDLCVEEYLNVVELMSQYVRITV
jgi:hypothetical protein